MSDPLPKPESPSAVRQSTGQYRPDELNPDLAAARMADELVKRLGKPSIISKKFAVRYGIFRGLNHIDKENETGYDCSMRIKVYDEVSNNSVNIDGKYFERIFAYLMKPKYVINGAPFGQSAFEDEKQTLFERLMGWGKPKNDSGNNNTK